VVGWPVHLAGWCTCLGTRVGTKLQHAILADETHVSKHPTKPKSYELESYKA
jgi:hypothetical protein